MCGKTGHMSKDCKNRVNAVTESGGTASGNSPPETASVDWAHLGEFLDVGTLLESDESDSEGLNALGEGYVRGVAPHHRQRRGRVGGARGMGTRASSGAYRSELERWSLLDCERRQVV